VFHNKHGFWLVLGMKNDVLTYVIVFNVGENDFDIYRSLLRPLIVNLSSFVLI